MDNLTKEEIANNLKGNYKIFEHKECEFFPCHPKGDNKKHNCLFCYCPAYRDDDCPGVKAKLATYTDEGVKDCTNCNLPHNPNNYSLFSGWNHRKLNEK